MALNRERPHLLVLPEDKATRSLAIGFSDNSKGAMQVLNEAGGWPHVLEEFTSRQIADMRRYTERHMVLLIDFDNDFPNRIAQFKAKIPADVADRVYVLGALGEAEDLKPLARRKLGLLGQYLADECISGSNVLWNDAQLQHNQAEVARLKQNVKSFLF